MTSRAPVSSLWRTLISRGPSSLAGPEDSFAPPGGRRRCHHLPWRLLLSLLLCCDCSVSVWGQEQDRENDPVARFVPVPSPVSDETLGLVRRTALEVQDTATRENRQGYLVLEMAPGISPFHQVYALADFLTADPLPNVTTIAWVPESVTGNNVLIALACNEIVLHPEAQLGDMGRGKALPADQQAIVRSIVAKRRNQKVNEPLATALMDPAVSLVQLTIDTGDNMRETRLVTQREAEDLRDEGQVILNSRTITEAGTPGLISGTRARTADILAVRTAQNRRELVDAYGISLDALRELPTAEKIDKVAYIQLHDEIDAIFAAFAERQIDRAVKDGAKLIIFEIDSPGGQLMTSIDLSERIAYLQDRDVKTVAYIPKQAYSGAAILAVACDEIYMHPDATIGNAIAFNMFTGAMPDQKRLSFYTEHLRKLAEMKNRPPSLVEAFADETLEVFEVTHKQTGRQWFMSADEIHKLQDEWQQGPRVAESRPGIALTVNGRRAHELKLTNSPVTDQEDLKQRLGIPVDHQFRVAGRTWIDSLVFILNSPMVTGMLFFLAIVFIYIELATMTGLFGILSALCFAIFFWSKMMGGTATGLEVVLFLLGLGCLAMEFFVVPGFGIFGVTGILLVLGSLIMASQTFTGFDLQYDLAKAGTTVATLGAALIAVIVFSMILSNYLPRIPILRDIVLSPPGAGDLPPDEPRLRPDATSEGAALVGATGSTLTVLRPAGKARIQGQLRDVISDGPYIAQGAAVKVVSVSGNRVVVREV